MCGDDPRISVSQRQCLFGGITRIHKVDFQRNITCGIAVVPEVGGGHAVEPDFDDVAQGLDAEVVPFAGWLLGRLGAGIVGEGVQPIVAVAEVDEDAAGPAALGLGIEFDHVTEKTGKGGVGGVFAAEEHAGIHGAAGRGDARS